MSSGAPEENVGPPGNLEAAPAPPPPLAPPAPVPHIGHRLEPDGCVQPPRRVVGLVHVERHAARSRTHLRRDGLRAGQKRSPDASAAHGRGNDHAGEVEEMVVGGEGELRGDVGDEALPGSLLAPGGQEGDVAGADHG